MELENLPHKAGEYGTALPSGTTKAEALRRAGKHDLALVCANCHRMIHAARRWLTVEQLRKLIATRQEAKVV